MLLSNCSKITIINLVEDLTFYDQFKFANFTFEVELEERHTRILYKVKEVDILQLLGPFNIQTVSYKQIPRSRHILINYYW